MPRDLMMKSMTSEEYSRWLALYLIEAEEEQKARLESEARSKLQGRMK